MFLIVFVNSCSILFRLFTQRRESPARRNIGGFCFTAAIPRLGPKAGGMFTDVPAKDGLSSEVIGLNVYRQDKQNIGTIKDIALDASGISGFVVGVGDFWHGRSLCRRAPIGNKLRCQGQQMACHHERGRRSA